MENNYSNEKKYSMTDLIEIMQKLQSVDGCPWDKEQTHESLTKCLIEEAYEACDAINEKSPEKMAEELGDVLLQVVFHAQIGQEENTFNMDDITDTICRKLIYRHPHIFGKEQFDSSEQVLESWEKLKIVEKGFQSQAESMKNIPKTFPALMRAYKIQQKAQRVGFDWPDISGALKKLYEETQELKQAIDQKDNEQQQEEAGDLMFAIVNVCRFLDLDPEQCLNSASDKFIKRFTHVEKSCVDNGFDMKQMTIKELDSFWDEAKK